MTHIVRLWGMNDGSIDHMARMSTMDFSHDTKFAQSQYLFKWLSFT